MSAEPWNSFLGGRILFMLRFKLSFYYVPYKCGYRCILVAPDSYRERMSLKLEPWNSFRGGLF